MKKYNKIIALILLILCSNIYIVSGQNCTPNVQYGAGTACVESRPICSLPYTYQYNYTNNSGNQGVVLEDIFSTTSVDGWLPISSSTKLETNNYRLAISLESGLGLIGAYKNMSVNSGTTYTLNTSIYRGLCDPATNIVVNIKDVSNNIVSTTTITSTTPVIYGYSVVNLQFLASSSGSYTIEFIKSGGGNCTFFVGSVKVTFPSCNSLNQHLWQYFYVDNSGVNLHIADNISSLLGAKVYGPYSTAERAEVCQGILVGELVPVIDELVLSGQNFLDININQGAGWYILEIIDDDCFGCIDITSTQGGVSCSAFPCPSNSSCENLQKLCDNTQFTTSCSCANNGNQLWYEFDITNITQALNITAISNSNGNPTYFGYTIAGPFPENYSCDFSDIDPNVVQLWSGFSPNLNFNSFPTIGTYLLVLGNACDGSISGDIDFNISFSPALNCGPITCPTDIVISCESSNPNLVMNGDFEVGSSGDFFVTKFVSEYTYVSTFPGNDGTYGVSTSFQPFFNIVDHTFGNNLGFFMFAHPIPFQNNTVWAQTIPNIIPNTIYNYTIWIAAQNGNGATSDKVKLIVNNQEIASVDPSAIPSLTWYKLSGTWNSTGYTDSLVDLKILMENKDDLYRLFIDDISFTNTVCNSCTNSEVNFTLNSSNDLNSSTLSWDFGDESASSEEGIHTYSSAGTYQITLIVSGPGECSYTTSTSIEITDCIPPPPCDSCIGSFSPIPNQKYVISAWVKENGAPLEMLSYDKAMIKMHFYGVDHTEFPQIGEFKASGMIIDGWQRIEKEFFVPSPTAYIGIELFANGVDAYFDDIRVFPFDASMKSYVYDPVNMRLVAELDERHYATFYEYDEEGKLIRIKKETEKGVMTIQETRNSTKKQ